MTDTPSVTTRRVPSSIGSVAAQEGDATPNSTSSPEGSANRLSVTVPHLRVQTSPTPPISYTQASSSRYGARFSVNSTTSTSESILASPCAQEPTRPTATTSGRPRAHSFSVASRVLTSSVRSFVTTDYLLEVALDGHHST